MENYDKEDLNGTGEREIVEACATTDEAPGAGALASGGLQQELVLMTTDALTGLGKPRRCP